MSKKWSIFVVCSILIILLFMAIINMIIDPFFQYSAPKEGLYYALRTEAYINPGIIKNFDYDSILFGSSMVENFKVSLLDEAFGTKTVKIPQPGGYFKNFDILFSIAFQRNPPPKNVFFGFDIARLHNDPKATVNPLPEYLYDNKVMNDISYLLNKEVVLRSFYALMKTLQNTSPKTMDEYGAWQDIAVFGRDEVIKGYSRRLEKNNMRPADYLLNVAKENVETNVIPHIRDNPNTSFYIFFPPYSILYWDARMRNGEFESVFNGLRYSMETLLQFENVSLFFFSDSQQIICDLDNYRDSTHFSIDVSNQIAQSLIDGTHQVTLENYDDILNTTYDFLLHFDYDNIFVSQR